MWSYIKSFFIAEDTQSICPNSLSPLPSNKFINYARTKAEVVEDIVPDRNYYHFKRMERLATKRYIERKRERRKSTQEWYDFFNH